MPGLPDPDTQSEFYDGVTSRRLVAWVIDVLITLAIGVPIAIVFGLVTLGIGFAAFPLVIAGTSIVYRTTTIAHASATWGMRAMGIELRRHDGGRLDPLFAFLHSAGYVFCITVFPLQIVSCIMILTLRYGQSLQDIFLRTAMINRPVS